VLNFAKFSAVLALKKRPGERKTLLDSSKESPSNLRTEGTPALPKEVKRVPDNFTSSSLSL